jgi:membrane protease YdiL (CAAX protease family)
MIHLLRDNTGKLRNGWWIAIFFLLLGALVVPATLYASAHGGTVTPAWQAALAFVATVACLTLRRERLSSVVGALPSWRTGVPVGLAWGFAIWTTAAAVLLATGDVQWLAGSDPARALVAGFSDCLAVAVVEELVFRGFVFQRLVAGVGAWPAQLAIAAYFVLTHSAGLAEAGDVRWLATANIFLASLLFGAAYLGTRSLALPIALHFMLNFTQGPLLGFGVSGNRSSGVLVPVFGDAPHWWTGGAFGLEASAVGTLAILVSLVAILAWKSQRFPHAPWQPSPHP